MALVAEHSAAISTHELKYGLPHDIFSMKIKSLRNRFCSISFYFLQHRCLNVINMDNIFPLSS